MPLAKCVLIYLLQGEILRDQGEIQNVAGVSIGFIIIILKNKKCGIKLLE